MLLAGGLACLVLGYGMDLSNLTPVIKKIATSSFVLVSGGWCLLALAFFYWWIDVRQHKKYLLFFIIVGINSIFIYLFFEIVGSRWFNGYIASISNGVTGWFNISGMPQYVIGCFCIFTLEWLLCYFLYKKKIFFKL
jgi:predicted acyltransferase